MLLLRDVQRSDLPGLKRLAGMLNTVNLPNNEKTLTQIVDRSVKSFTGKIENPFEREYVFVLEDLEREVLVGTSMIIAQHGTFEAPHIYMDVVEREHYSATVDVHFRHRVLSIGYNYDGPTETGGLVVDPPYRGNPEKVGKQLSYVRFLYMALHRRNFRDRVLAELLPPLLPDGRSPLWEACGKKFTGMSYKEADRLSRKNKEFIKELFPSSGIYATLFPARVQEAIGQVGPDSKGVQRMLERIGFRYVNHVDPFDGGPHFEADLDDITLVRAFRTARLSEREPSGPGQDALVGYERAAGRGRFRAIRTAVQTKGALAFLPSEARAALDAPPGTKLAIIPFA